MDREEECVVIGRVWTGNMHQFLQNGFQVLADILLLGKKVHFAEFASHRVRQTSDLGVE